MSRKFLRGELTRSAALVLTPDCRGGRCVGCGVCDFKRVRMRLYDPAGREPPIPVSGGGYTSARPSGEAERIRLRFSKTGRMSLLSHLEQLSLFTRVVRRAQVPIRFTMGFHPHPKFSFATALPVGVESRAEYLDMEVDAGCDPAMVMERLNALLPPEIRIMEAVGIPRETPSLSVMMDSVLYRVTLPDNIPIDLESRVEAFMALDSLPFRRVKKGKSMEIDLREDLLQLRAAGNILEMTIRRAKPLEVAAAVTGLSPAELSGARIEKLEVFFKE